MLLLDDRTGSGDLLPLLKTYGCPAELTRMEFGDAAFVGNGPHDQPVQIGLEIKTIGDVVNCMVSGRFAAHQLPGLLRDYDQTWLVIEGLWRAGRPEGILQVYHPGKGYWFDLRSGGRRWMWKEVCAWCATMMNLGNIRVWQTPDRDGTARFVAAQYHWWQKPYGSHSSLKTFVDYKARVGAQPGQSAMLSAPSFARRMFKELPGIGWEKSLAVEQAFPNVHTAINADEKAWQSIDGIGPTTAKKIHRALRGLK